MNYAAFMDDCLRERSYNTSDMGNSTFLNFCSVNLNNNLSSLLNTAYNPLVSQPEAFIQYWKQRLQLELTAAVNQFFLSNSNASVLNNTFLNNSTTVLPATSTNSITEQSHKNPCKTYQESNGQEFSTITRSFEESTDRLINLNINESNNFNVQNSTTAPSLETLPKVSSRDSNFLGFKEQNSFSSKSMEGFETGKNEFGVSENYESIETRQENFVANGANIGHDAEFTVHQLHDTNPFKQHIIRGFNVRVESRKEESLKTNIEHDDNIIKPPVPPRNPYLINNTADLGTKHITDVMRTTLPEYNNQQNIPATRIHYKADPVMYNSKTETTCETPSELGNRTTSLSGSVSFGGNNHYDIANSSQAFTNHSLSKNISFNFERTNSSEGYQNSLQSGIDSQLGAAQTNNIFNPRTKLTTGHTQCMSSRIISNNYRPPLPPYNDNNSVEYVYKRKSPISPRFTSPVVSENSKAAIEEVQLATEFNFFDKLKSVVTETPDPTKRDKMLMNLGKREAHTSSSPTKNIKSATTVSESTSYSQNATRSSTPYKIKLIIPKFLQGQQSTVAKQEPPDTLYQTQVLNETLGITPGIDKMTQDFVKEKQSSLMRKENNSILPWSVEHQESYNLNGGALKNSGRSESYPNPFEIETGNMAARLAYDSLHKKKTENASSAMPTLHNPQTSVNELHFPQKAYDNCSVASTSDKAQNNNRFKFSNTEPGNTTTNNISYPHQAQPLIPPLYPNISQLQQGSDYPYHMPPPDMQHPQITQRMPLFRSNVHGFHLPASHWSRPQFFNPGYSHPRNNSPPMTQPYPWNSYNSHMFVHKQTDYKHSMPIPNSETTSKTDCNKESVSLNRLNHEQILGEKNKENINTVQNEKSPNDISSELAKNTIDQSATSSLTDPISCYIPNELKNCHFNDMSNLKDCTLPKQLHELNTSSNEKISENRTKKFAKEDTTFTQGWNSVQVLTTLPLRNNSENSLNGIVNNISQHNPHQTMTNIFKPVEVNKQTIYLFKIENEGWACTDEIALAFTPYEDRNMILRLLELVQVHINFKEVSRAQSPLLFSNLDSTTVRLPRMANSKRIKGTLHLTPLNSLIRMMYYLKVISVEEIICSPLQKQLPPGSKVPELVKLITAYRIDDKYWVA